MQKTQSNLLFNNHNSSTVNGPIQDKNHFEETAISRQYISQINESLQKSHISIDSNSNEANVEDHLDNQNDFNYSQKLFHISDGNLYSIFSPIQGRSYGMKPSFLRKQKYTLQECHGRGRKNLRKGLKFHNFLPSEYVTSEKDNNLLQPKWKVRAECRLREEHGTKQITISNWSQSIQNEPRTPPLETQPIKSSFLKNKVFVKSSISQIDSSDSAQQPDPYDFTLQNDLIKNKQVSKKISQECTSTVSKPRDALQSLAAKKDSLHFVLNSLHGRSVHQKSTYDCPKINSSYENQKHRRKPVETRRVVPYGKYLSIIEEKDDAVPLDLSSKDPTALIHHDLLEVSISENESTYSSTLHLKTEQEPSSPPSSVHIPSAVERTFPGISQPPLMLLAPSVSTFDPSSIRPLIRNTSDNPSTTSKVRPMKIKQPNLGANSLGKQFVQQTAFINKPCKLRRRNQRSVIKQKLEDTFRQNGFLVKTKQVSDGEATFCKFRQLRKYTRYYLKSWQHHLPDEVHKMWKGFLPPKSVLPTVSDLPADTLSNLSFEST